MVHVFAISRPRTLASTWNDLIDDERRIVGHAAAADAQVGAVGAKAWKHSQVQIAELDVAVQLFGERSWTIRWRSVSDDSGTAAMNITEHVTAAAIDAGIVIQNHGRFDERPSAGRRLGRWDNAVGDPSTGAF